MISNISYASAFQDKSNGNGFLPTMLLYLLLFLVVIVITVYGTKFIAKRSKKIFNSKYMKVIDTININFNTKLILAKIIDKVYIILINNNNATLIDKLDADNFNFDNADKDTNKEEGINFQNYLDNLLGSSKKGFSSTNENIKKRVSELKDKYIVRKIKKSKEDEKNEKNQ